MLLSYKQDVLRNCVHYKYPLPGRVVSDNSLKEFHHTVI